MAHAGGEQPIAGLSPTELARAIEGHHPEGAGLSIRPRFAAVEPRWVARLVVAARSGGARLVREGGGEVIATAGVGAGRELVVPAADAPDLWDPWERHRAEAQVRARLVERWIRAGVRFDAPERALLDLTVTLSPGARVGADVTLSGRTEIGPDAVIGQGAALHDTTVGEGAEIKPYTVATGAVIGPRCAVGPFAHLREGAVLEADVKVGNFVEVKKAVLRQGAKASHLSYLGDAEIGPGANVGAGTITCNYDGFSKHRTEIGAGAFIGSNTALVAPVAVGAGAIVGAGSVITRDVPADALAVERTPQRNLEGMAAQLRARNARKKESR